MRVSPSLLSADFTNLERDINMINGSKADYLHLDIMDGVFVPNISFGIPVCEAVARKSKKPLDVHLMIVEPQKWIDKFHEMGAHILTVHLEACSHLHRTISCIKDCGMKAGVSLNPATPISLLEDIITDLDLVLIMSVNPGFGGQKFIPQSLKKIGHLRSLIAETGSKAYIEVDGGVNEETGRELANAGADILVAGNYVFKSENPVERIDILKQLCKPT